MDYRTFGRTGLRVSIAGIGAGGASRLGLAYGSTPEQAIAVIHRGLELGINYFDTAENYRTEEVVGRALEGHRDEVVISSKIGPRTEDGALLDAKGLRRAVEVALDKLRTDVLDVYHLHRVSAPDYEYCVGALIPEFVALREEGKLRFIGISESTSGDASHDMLHRAVQDDCWDVMMVGFNLFNQSARATVFPTTIDKDVAIEIMASARSQFSRPEELAVEINKLVAAGTIDAAFATGGEPLAGLLDGAGVESLAELSYRFAAHEPGVHVVLVGTGNLAHLEENVRSLSAGPLPSALHEQIVSLFGHLTETVYVPGRTTHP